MKRVITIHDYVNVALPLVGVALGLYLYATQARANPTVWLCIAILCLGLAGASARIIALKTDTPAKTIERGGV